MIVAPLCDAAALAAAVTSARFSVTLPELLNRRLLRLVTSMGVAGIARTSLTKATRLAVSCFMVIFFSAFWSLWPN